MQAGRCPRKRCAVGVKNGLQIVFVTLPKPPDPPPPVEIEPLMFFENVPPPQAPPVSQSAARAANKWERGWVVVPLVVNGNGEMERWQSVGKGEFSSLKEAYEACGPFELLAEYLAVFGCTLLDRIYLLVATRVEVIASLPFGGAIQRVLSTEWVPLRIPDAVPLCLLPTDRSRLEEFQHYSYERGYYYSDDADLSYPFPFLPPAVAAAPTLHCDWSEHLRQPFRPHGLSEGCSVLLRGFAEEAVVKLKNGSPLHMLLLGRQNNLNPGPRYLGRGLNGNNAAGNDHFYEYVLWRSNEDGSVFFARHTILRGTIPVHWSTQFHRAMGEPSMVFSPNREEVLRGCDVYFEFVFRQLASLIRYDTGNALLNAAPKLRCVSLLRQNPQHGEGVLARHFLDAVRKSDAVVSRLFHDAQLDLVHLDWLNLVKDYGVDVVTRTFWESILEFLAPQGNEALATVGVLHCDGSVTRRSCQRRFLRVNCADSLDRTNLGCFFTCFQASISMLRSLEIGLDQFVDQTPLPPLQGQDDASQCRLSSFSLGGNKMTITQPFVCTWYEARNPSLCPVAVVRALSELYVHNGDVVAQLYTSSAAMHSNLLRSICGLRSTAHNAVIATQRRFENVFEDRSKFRSLELLLGRNKDIHFPSMSQSFLTRPVPLQYWTCALIAMGVPLFVSSLDLAEAVRQAVEEIFSLKLPACGLASNSSFAQGFCISLAEDEVASHKEFLTAVGQVTFEQPPPMAEDDGAVLHDNERIAVIEFDHDRFDASHVQRFLQARETLRVLNCSVTLVPYTYPIQGTAENSAGLVKKAANSLRSGLKNFVRGLNS
ncbi:putative inositol 5'-phosphatase [Trypanosoma conorhini]|uniref:Putative inositol 5'-phosphatase n=1 Tax=Trypanosoma conorhini TaxID=83891 RepID=A0A3R7P0R1_9TRYP|nr:putative inositol 5'-phosphatase [Trypanosoma conorhini]RNF26965.1 putative inositol 5'-phosphatase [Trypanosoma conorhini]